MHGAPFLKESGPTVPCAMPNVPRPASNGPLKVTRFNDVRPLVKAERLPSIVNRRRGSATPARLRLRPTAAAVASTGANDTVAAARIGPIRDVSTLG